MIKKRSNPLDVEVPEQKEAKQPEVVAEAPAQQPEQKPTFWGKLKNLFGFGKKGE